MDMQGRSTPATLRGGAARARGRGGPTSLRRVGALGSALTALVGCATSDPVAFRRASDGAQATCERPARISEMRGDGRKRFRECVLELESRGYTRVSPGASPDAQPIPGTADVASAPPEPEEIAAQIAGLEAQIRSRGSYLADRLTAEQAQLLMPFVQSVMDGAMSRGSDEQRRSAQQELDGLMTRVGMRRDVRDELYGMLQDWARLAELQARSGRGTAADRPAPPPAVKDTPARRQAPSS